MVPSHQICCLSRHHIITMNEMRRSFYKIQVNTSTNIAHCTVSICTTLSVRFTSSLGHLKWHAGRKEGHGKLCTIGTLSAAYRENLMNEDSRSCLLSDFCFVRWQTRKWCVYLMWFFFSISCSTCGLVSKM